MREEGREGGREERKEGREGGREKMGKMKSEGTVYTASAQEM